MGLQPSPVQSITLAVATRYAFFAARMICFTDMVKVLGFQWVSWPNRQPVDHSQEKALQPRQLKALVADKRKALAEYFPFPFCKVQPCLLSH